MATAFANQAMEFKLKPWEVREGMRVQLNRAGQIMLGKVLRIPGTKVGEMISSHFMIAPEAEINDGSVGVHLVPATELAGDSETAILAHPQGALDGQGFELESLVTVAEPPAAVYEHVPPAPQEQFIF